MKTSNVERHDCYMSWLEWFTNTPEYKHSKRHEIKKQQEQLLAEQNIRKEIPLAA